MTPKRQPCPVVDPNYGRRHKRRTAASSDDPQQSILADRHHEATRKAGRRSAAKCETKVMDDMIETRRSARPRGKHVIVEALGEDPPPA